MPVESHHSDQGMQVALASSSAPEVVVDAEKRSGLAKPRRTKVDPMVDGVALFVAAVAAAVAVEDV